MPYTSIKRRSCCNALEKLFQAAGPVLEDGHNDRMVKSQERSAPAMSDRLKNERNSSYKKDSEMAPISTGTTSSSPRITSSSSTTPSTTTPSVLSLHQSAHHQPALHHLQHHLQHLHQSPGTNAVEGTTTAADGAHHHHHHHQAHLQQQQHQHHLHNGTASGLTSLVPGHHSPLNSPASSSGGGSSLSPYGLSPHGTGSGGTPTTSSAGSNMIAQPYASDASGFGPIYHHHHHHHHHNPLAGGPAPYMGHPSFVDKYKLSVTPPPPPPPPPPSTNTLTPPGTTYTGHYQGFYASASHPGAGMLSSGHHTMAHGARATVASIACRDRADHGWYP
uniref:Uncharacterized protein n=1 Tax=Anopheles minimus TaxID=112268 RepID=A0A182VR51_9DIPT